jgi:hypothetical protein
VTPNLTMDLSCFAIGLEKLRVLELSSRVEASFLRSRSSRVINIGVTLNLTDWVFSSGK